MNVRSAKLPLYAQVEQELAESILSGELVPGTRLPTEDTLIGRFQVSRITVRRAMQNLSARGLVEIRHGVGTFAAEPMIEQPLTELRGFVEDMDNAGVRAAARVVSTRTAEATAEIAEALQLNVGAPVTVLERVRLGNGRPLSFDRTYLTHDLGSQVVQHDLEVHPVFTLLEEQYGIPLVDATYKLEAVAADAHVASMLEIPIGSAVFLITRTTFTVDAKPVDYERLHYRGDAVSFVTRLRRNPAGAR